MTVVGDNCVGRSIRLPERHFPAPLSLVLANERPAKCGKALLRLDLAQEFGLGLLSVGKQGIGGRLAASKNHDGDYEDISHELQRRIQAAST